MASLKIVTTKLEQKIKEFDRQTKRKAANAINRILTSGRKMVVEDLIAKTGLKRKMLNDRIVITRAKYDNPIGRLTPIFGEKRLTLIDYGQHVVSLTRGNRKVIRGAGPRYRKILKTGFYGFKDLIYMRNGSQREDITRAWGRSVPGLWEDYKIIERFQREIQADFQKELAEEMKNLQL